MCAVFLDLSSLIKFPRLLAKFSDFNLQTRCFLGFQNQRSQRVVVTGENSASSHVIYVGCSPGVCFGSLSLSNSTLSSSLE